MLGESLPRSVTSSLPPTPPAPSPSDIARRAGHVGFPNCVAHRTVSRADPGFYLAGDVDARITWFKNTLFNHDALKTVLTWMQAHKHRKLELYSPSSLAIFTAGILRFIAIWNVAHPAADHQVHMGACYACSCAFAPS